MRIEKKTLNDALRVLGKMVCQTSPVELYRSVRFVGDVDGVMAMATNGVETVCRWSYGDGDEWRGDRFGDSGCIR